MNVAGLTVEHIKSHLQMYRASVKQAIKSKSADHVSVQLTRGMTNQEVSVQLQSLQTSNEDELNQFLEQLVASSRGVEIAISNESPSHQQLPQQQQQQPLQSVPQQAVIPSQVRNATRVDQIFFQCFTHFLPTTDCACCECPTRARNGNYDLSIL
jgi:hypothetical protein